MCVCVCDCVTRASCSSPINPTPPPPKKKILTHTFSLSPFSLFASLSLSLAASLDFWLLLHRGDFADRSGYEHVLRFVSRWGKHIDRLGESREHLRSRWLTHHSRTAVHGADDDDDADADSADTSRVQQHQITTDPARQVRAPPPRPLSLSLDLCDQGMCMCRAPTRQESAA